MRRYLPSIPAAFLVGAICVPAWEICTDRFFPDHVFWPLVWFFFGLFIPFAVACGDLGFDVKRTETGRISFIRTKRTPREFTLMLIRIAALSIGTVVGMIVASEFGLWH